jgi:coenzyme F420-reducing hydrogenase gamma subunit
MDVKSRVRLFSNLRNTDGFVNGIAVSCLKQQMICGFAGFSVCAAKCSHIGIKIKRKLPPSGPPAKPA